MNEATSSDRFSESVSLGQVTRKAMGTEFVILVPALGNESDAAAMEAAVEAADLVERIENDLSVYRPTSEVSRMNLVAAEMPVRVSQSTFLVLQRALHWSAVTSGAFDITSGPLVEAWGFLTRSGKKPSPETIAQAVACVGYEKLQLDIDHFTVRYAKPGMSVNLGGIGKGDALDRMATLLKQCGVNNFLIHGGNSSVIAAGDQVRESGLGWAIGLAHPTKPRRRLAGLWLKDAALATSGSGKQFFHYKGRRYGHVIDPRTGYPSGDLLSLTIVMDNATDADAFATGLFVAGRSEVRTQFNNGLLKGAILVQAGSEQDSTTLESLGEFDWIEPPS